MKATIYIREADIPLWQEIENKSLWVHQQLNEVETSETEIKRVVEQVLNDKQQELYGWKYWYVTFTSRPASVGNLCG